MYAPRTVLTARAERSVIGAYMRSMEPTTTRHPTFSDSGFTLSMIAAFALVTHAVIPSLLFGLIAGIFVAAGLADARLGVIPNSLMATAALAGVALQIAANGAADGGVRIAVVVILWGLIATARFSRGGVGGGDLKMIGATWLVLAAFPVPLALVLSLAWALILSSILAATRLTGKARHLRAGLALAGASIATNLLGCVILAHSWRN